MDSPVRNKETERSKTGRRNFIRVLSYAMVAILGYFWVKAQRIHQRTVAKKRIQIPSGLPIGVHFIDNLILNISASQTLAFSAHCTHLGCRIQELKDDELLCPCHGSKFSKTGEVLNGPAQKNLQQLEIKSDETGTYVELT